MPTIQTLTTYLEMFGPPTSELTPPRNDVQIQRLAAPSVETYREMYRAVGANLNWVDRLLMPREQLQEILEDTRVEVFVLLVAGEMAGYAELDRRVETEIELAYFGLRQKFLGQGLGKYLLHWTLRTAWTYRPKRVWVHTCDLDHPAALPNYLQAGLQIYDEKIHAQFVPDKQDREPALED